MTAWEGASTADAPQACYQNSVASPLPVNFVAACGEIVRAFRSNASAADAGTEHSWFAGGAAEALRATAAPVPLAAGASEGPSRRRGAAADYPSDHWGTSSLSILQYKEKTRINQFRINQFRPPTRQHLNLLCRRANE